MAAFQLCKFFRHTNRICKLLYAAFRIFAQQIVWHQQFDGKSVRLQLEFIARN